MTRGLPPWVRGVMVPKHNYPTWVPGCTIMNLKTSWHVRKDTSSVHPGNSWHRLHIYSIWRGRVDFDRGELHQLRAPQWSVVKRIGYGLQTVRITQRLMHEAVVKRSKKKKKKKWMKGGNERVVEEIEGRRSCRSRKLAIVIAYLQLATADNDTVVSSIFWMGYITHLGLGLKICLVNYALLSNWMTDLPPYWTERTSKLIISLRGWIYLQTKICNRIDR